MSGSDSPTSSTRHSGDFSIISRQDAYSNDRSAILDQVSSSPWMIREILNTIFFFLIPQYDLLTQAVLQGKTYNLAEDRATLLAAALTCHAISGSAQAALWNTMDSFVPMIPLLPLSPVDGKYKIDDIPVCDSRCTFGSSSHLSLVKVFVFDKTEWLMSDFAIQMAFTSIAPVLFPRLSRLVIPKFKSGLTPNQTLFLPCLLASPLTDVVVGGIDDSQTFDAFTSVLAFRARNSLQSIACAWMDLPRTITSLPSLHTVTIAAPLSNQDVVIADLCECPSLRRLELCLSKAFPDEPNSAIRTPKLVFFDHLESLTLSGEYVGICDFLGLLKTRNLQELQLRPEVQIGTNKFQAYMTNTMLLLSAQPYQSLKALEITYNGKPEIPIPSFVSPHPSVCRTFFKGLSALPLACLHFSGPILIPAVPLNLITSYFPNLHTLYLPRYRKECVPTWDDLHSLARNAPKLRHLGTRIQTRPIQRNPPASNHCLDTLYVYSSQIEDTWYATEQLDQSFPYLRKVTTGSTASAECQAGWKEVEELLGLCQRSRRRF